ncbi:MAG TPA: ATP-binding protein [Acidisarcina sp.]
MRSLFVRVFLSFWATIAVIIVGQHLLRLRYTSETGVPELLFYIALSGLPCLLIARYFAAPIVRLRNASQKIAGGDLTVRLGPTSSRRKDEVGWLVRDFDYMAERLELSRDAQKRLTADVSHELRSPLTRLTVALELARTHAGEGAAKALDRVELESHRLNDLIGKLLLLSTLESGGTFLERTAIRLDDLIANVVADADFEARSLNRAVKFSPAGPCTVSGNADLLRSAVENVVRNAVRFTAEGTEVLVTLRCSADTTRSTAVIAVTDHGPGVPQDELQRLFEPFYRIESARDRKTGDAGLGLAITRRAVEFHGGTVAAHNLLRGGLAVRIEIPARLLTDSD